MKHLFLEGPVRTGKSTLLLECISDIREYAGGFCCIRLTDSSGNVRGFRLAPPDADYREQPYDSSLPDIFLESGPDGMTVTILISKEPEPLVGSYISMFSLPCRWLATISDIKSDTS